VGCGELAASVPPKCGEALGEMPAPNQSPVELGTVFVPTTGQVRPSYARLALETAGRDSFSLLKYCYDSVIGGSTESTQTTRRQRNLGVSESIPTFPPFPFRLLGVACSNTNINVSLSPKSPHCLTPESPAKPSRASSCDNR
jgi:hypothetical protein